MKNLSVIICMILMLGNVIAQPNFTSSDMPNIGDNDTVLFINYSGNISSLDAATGNGYNWDMSGIAFLSSIYNIDTYRVKTDPISTPFVDATIEEFITGASGQVVNLYDYSNDTLFIHREGTAFAPPMPSIKFPILFNQTSDITSSIYYGTTIVGERRTTAHYDGFGTLQMPTNKTYSNVFRIKQIVKDTNYVINTTTTYISYIWYKQGGQVPLLRITNAGGVNFIAHGSKSNNISTGINENNSELTTQVYPNPTQGQINLNSNKRIISITVYNLLGKQVLTKEVNAQEAKINIDHLPKGMYVVNLIFDEGSLSKKVILE